MIAAGAQKTSVNRCPITMLLPIHVTASSASAVEFPTARVAKDKPMLAASHLRCVNRRSISHNQFSDRDFRSVLHWPVKYMQAIVQEMSREFSETSRVKT